MGAARTVLVVLSTLMGIAVVDVVGGYNVMWAPRVPKTDNELPIVSATPALSLAAPPASPIMPADSPLQTVDGEGETLPPIAADNTRPEVMVQTLVPFVRRLGNDAPPHGWCVSERASTSLDVSRGPTCPAGGNGIVPQEATPGAWPRCHVDFGTQDTCMTEPVRFGNFTTQADLAAFDAFPTVPPTQRTWRAVSAAQRAAYWRFNPNPFAPRCATCRGGLVHQSMLYSARRWWVAPQFATLRLEEGKVVRQRHRDASIVGLARDKLMGTRFNPMQDDYAPAADAWVNVSLGDATKIVFCISTDNATQFADDAFVGIATGGTAPSFHVMRTALPAAGARCFWRTLQLLFLSSDGVTGEATTLQLGLQRVPVVRLMSRQCGTTEENAAAQQHLVGQTPPVGTEVPMKPDKRLPYLPCHQHYVGDLTRQATLNHMIDRRYLNFWANKCDRAYADRDGTCPGVTAPTVHGAPKPSGSANSSRIRVAVCMSGFLRSFATSRNYIWRHVIEPHDADVFGVTWNVIGRSKKGAPIHPKRMIAVHKMHTMLMNLIRTLPTGGRSHTDRYTVEVNDYKRMQRYHSLIKNNGFFHAGMYNQLQRSVELMLLSRREYDIVIRTRWDLFPAARFSFTPLQPHPEGAAAGVAGVARADRRRFLLDMRVACSMDGVWYPQRLVVEEGKVIRHLADTRFKLFAWQSCDWLDVGLFETMKKFGRIFDWIRENNVFSGAQFVEHGWMIDQDIAYQPAQLYMCLHRHTTRFFC